MVLSRNDYFCSAFKQQNYRMTKRSTDPRKTIIILIILLVGFVFILRLFHLQLIDQTYKLSSQNNVLRYITQYPARGMIYDRNGELMVFNEAAYDLLVIPRQVKIIDTAEFCGLLNISVESFEQRLLNARQHSSHRPSVFLEQVSKEEYGFIIEKMYRFPGFYFQARTLRRYPLPVAAHTMGDIGEVNPSEMNSDSYYRMGDYIGKSGIERFYEEQLRGKKGLKIVLVDVFNREMGSYQEGKFDTLPVAGKNLIISIDAHLQQYGEALMRNKAGSIVAIEPATGEILALITSPVYDPNLLVGRVRGENYNMLLNDSIKPLINRAISGTYPPGSTFKMVNALAAMQLGAINPSTQFSCQGTTSTPIRCSHAHQSPLALHTALEHSCNPYFWNTFRNTLNNPRIGNLKLAYEKWFEIMHNFGFGHRFDTDIPFELPGNIPSRAYFDRIYRGRWNALTVRSLSIGQGEILLTPLQLANMTVIIGNGGFYYPPHILKQIEGEEGINERFTTPLESGIDKKHFTVIQDAMLDVFEGERGTARWHRIPGIRAAGKTGTVQNPHGKDHSLFIAYAPFDNPQIAISVIVENGGFGSVWAAPIATLMIEKYLNGEVMRKPLEQRMMDGVILP
jgi:penicillin-binding protein 2